MSTITLDYIFQNYFKDSFIEDIICENFSSVRSEARKTTFNMCQTLKEPPSVLKIIFQKETFDIVDGRAKNNICKVAIKLEFFIKITSQKENISYTLVSLIMHDGTSLYCGHYISDIFNTNTGIWWHCDSDEITEISDFPEGIYTIESHKKKKKIVSGS